MLLRKINIIVGEDLKGAKELAKVFLGDIKSIIITGKIHISALNQICEMAPYGYNLILEYPEIGCNIKTQKSILSNILKLIDNYVTINIITYSNHIIVNNLIAQSLLSYVNYDKKSDSLTIIDEERAEKILFSKEI